MIVLLPDYGARIRERINALHKQLMSTKGERNQMALASRISGLREALDIVCPPCSWTHSENDFLSCVNSAAPRRPARRQGKKEERHA